MVADNILNVKAVFNQGAAKGSVQARAHRQPEPGPDVTAGMGMTFMDFFLPVVNDDIPAWSIWPGRRDSFLRAFWKTEPIMAGAVYSAVARTSALVYNFTSNPKGLKTKYYQNMMKYCDFGVGFETLIEKTVTDLLTQDNGAFWEIRGAGHPEGRLVGPVQSIAHMDSSRCWRTFDPKYPVIYVDPTDGTYHAMHHTRVAPMSIMPQPNELARNIGFCAVSRALRAVQIMKAIQIFKHEKITGSRPGIGYGNGFNNKQFRNAIQAAENEDAASGTVVWKRVPFILNPDSNARIDMKVLSLAGLPDGFDAEKDTTLYVYALALAFGVDAREFWPATSSGATKADANIQHLKARGKGMANILRTIETTLDRKVFPEDGSVSGQYDYTDDEEDRMAAVLRKTQADTLYDAADHGAIDAQELRDSLLAIGVLDKNIISKKLPETAKPKQTAFEENSNLTTSEDRNARRQPRSQSAPGEENT